ncbi:MAG TPA: polysaccharide biosynthesis/export family protein [Terriglobales bacterium]|nr:polysaccharide biosynthesis/export family protein [Terriglobales bacterium]
MFSKRCIAALVFCMVFLPVCEAQRTPAESETRSILTGLALEVTVAGEPELSGTVVVQADGTITLPLLNDVHAAGLTIQQLQAQLKQKLEQFIRQPRVTVVAAGMAERHRIWVAPGTPRPWLLPDLWPIR